MLSLSPEGVMAQEQDCCLIVYTVYSGVFYSSSELNYGRCQTLVWWPARPCFLVICYHQIRGLGQPPVGVLWGKTVCLAALDSPAHLAYTPAVPVCVWCVRVWCVRMWGEGPGGVPLTVNGSMKCKKGACTAWQSSSLSLRVGSEEGDQRQRKGGVCWEWGKEEYYRRRLRRERTMWDRGRKQYTLQPRWNCICIFCKCCTVNSSETLAWKRPACSVTVGHWQQRNEGPCPHLQWQPQEYLWMLHVSCDPDGQLHSTAPIWRCGRERKCRVGMS